MQHALLALSFLVLPIAPAYGQDIETYMLGEHRVTLEPSEDGFETDLKIDGVALHRNAYIVIETVQTIGGTPVALGTSSAGGNACSASPFVISIPNAGNARLDGPLDSCAPIDIERMGDGYRFVEAVAPGTKARAWQWSLADRLVKLDLPVAEPEGGWDDLDLTDGFLTYAILGNREVLGTLQAVLGDDMALYRRLAEQPGLLNSVDTVAGITAIRAVDKFSHEDQSITYVDAENRAMFVTMTVDGRTVTAPPADQWPEALRADAEL